MPKKKIVTVVNNTTNDSSYQAGFRFAF